MAIKINGATTITNSRRGVFRSVNPGAYSTADRPPGASEGDVIYDTDEKTIFVWDGTEWTAAGGGVDFGSLEQPVFNTPPGDFVGLWNLNWTPYADLVPAGETSEFYYTLLEIASDIEFQQILHVELISDENVSDKEFNAAAVLPEGSSGYARVRVSASIGTKTSEPLLGNNTGTLVDGDSYFLITAEETIDLTPYESVLSIDYLLLNQGNNGNRGQDLPRSGPNNGEHSHGGNGGPGTSQPIFFGRNNIKFYPNIEGPTSVTIGGDTTPDIPAESDYPFVSYYSGGSTSGGGYTGGYRGGGRASAGGTGSTYQGLTEDSHILERFGAVFRGYVAGDGGTGVEGPFASDSQTAHGGGGGGGGGGLEMLWDPLSPIATPGTVQSGAGGNGGSCGAYRPAVYGAGGNGGYGYGSGGGGGGGCARGGNDQCGDAAAGDGGTAYPKTWLIRIQYQSAQSNSGNYSFSSYTATDEAGYYPLYQKAYQAQHHSPTYEYDVFEINGEIYYMPVGDDLFIKQANYYGTYPQPGRLDTDPPHSVKKLMYEPNLDPTTLIEGSWNENSSTFTANANHW